MTRWPSFSDGVVAARSAVIRYKLTDPVAGLLLLGTWSIGLTAGKWGELGRGLHPDGGTHLASASGSRIVADCCPPSSANAGNLAPEARCQQSLVFAPAVIGPWPLGPAVNDSRATKPPRLSGRRPVGARLGCIRRSPSGPGLSPGGHPSVYHPPDGSLPVGLESG